MAFTTRRKVLAGVAATLATTPIAPSTNMMALAADNVPSTHTVEITKFRFVPDRLNIKPGDTIVWVNRDVVPHTATADDKSWDTGSIGKNQSKSQLATGDMATTYYCRFHPMMKAALAVSVSN